MTKNATKKSLLLSVLSMLLCMTMLIGTTYAWFTDTDTAATSNIVSGTLDIEIVDENGNEKTDALAFVDANGNSNILWEPGVTFRTEGFAIKNIGNLYLKFNLVINNTEVSYHKLNEVIEFSLVDENGATVDLSSMKGIALAPQTTTGTYFIQGHMDENAGNEYQGLTLTGVSITVYATQQTEEYDSFNNTYDEGAFIVDEANKVLVIDNAEGLIALAKKVNAGDSLAGWTVKLDKDVDLAGAALTPIGDKAQKAFFSGTFDGQGNTISNFTVTAPEAAGLFGDLRGTVKNLNATNATVNGNHYAGVIAGYATDHAGAAVVKCTVSDSSVTVAPEIVGLEYDNGDKAGGIIGYIAAGNPGITGNTVDNVTVIGYRDVGGIAGAAGGPVSNNTVKNSTLKLDDTNAYKADVQTTVSAIIGRDLGATATNNTSTNNIVVTPTGIDNDTLVGAFGGNYETVKMGNDVTLTDTVTITSTTTFDLCGNTLTVDSTTGVPFVVADGATLTVTNGTINFSANESADVMKVTNSVAGTTTTLNLENVALNFAPYIDEVGPVSSAIVAEAEEGAVVVNINKGTTISSGAQHSAPVVVGKNATVVMNDGVITGSQTGAPNSWTSIYGVKLTDATAVFTMNGGIINAAGSNTSSGICANAGTVNLNGGTINVTAGNQGTKSGYSIGIEAYGATLNLNGGTINVMSPGAYDAEAIDVVSNTVINYDATTSTLVVNLYKSIWGGNRVSEDDSVNALITGIEK